MSGRPEHGNANSRLNQLRKLFEDSAAHLRDEALRCNGAVSADDLESLERLGRLVKIFDEARAGSVRSHWPLIALFVGSLVIVSLLLFTGPRSTEIEMDLHVDQLSFALSQRQVLSGPLQLASLGVTGLGEVDLPRTQDSNEKTLRAGRDFESSIAFAALPTGQLTLPELVLPGRSKVVVEKLESPLQYRLTVPAANVDFSADVNGPLSVKSMGREQTMTLVSPKSVAFQTQAPQVDLDLTFTSQTQKFFGAPLAVQALSLLRVEDRPGIEGLPPRRVSTILSGTVYFEELNGKKVALRPGEVIELEGSEGEIESLQLKSDIVMQFRGHVHDIKSGPADIRRSLMPTWLEWLKARQGLSLLWGSVLYLFGVVAGVIRWLRGSE